MLKSFAPLQQRPILGYLSGLSAVICMVLAGLRFRWIPGQPADIPYEALNLLLLGGLLLAIAVYILKPPPDFFTPTSDALTLPRLRIVWIIVGAAALVLLALLNGHPTLNYLPVSQHLQMLLFVVGVFLVTFGLGGFTGWKIRPTWTSLLLFIITLLALAVRVWQLNDALHIMIDEIHFHIGIVEFQQNLFQDLLTPLNGIAAFPHLYSYLQNITVALFGTDLDGPRYISVLVGTLAIPAIYWLAKAAFNRETALIAAVLLAFFPPHMHFSRLALNNIADALFPTLALACLVNAFRHNHGRDYVLAGIFLGLSSYFYEGGRLVTLALFIIWGGGLLITGRFHTHWRGMGLLVLAAVLIAFPYYYTMFNLGYGATTRVSNEGVRLHYLLRDLGQETPWTVLQRHYDEAIRPALFHTVYYPDSSHFYYGGDTGIIPFYIVPLYLLGLAYALWLRWTGGLLWLWVIISLLGISLVVTTDWTVRFVVLFPVMALLSALGLSAVSRLLWPKQLASRLRLTGIALLLTILSVVQTVWYFNIHLPELNVQVRSIHDFYDALDRAAAYPGARLIFITNEPVYEPVLQTTIALRHMSLTYTILNSDTLSDADLNAIPRINTLLFFIRPDDGLSGGRIFRLFGSLPGPYFSHTRTVPLDSQYALYIYTVPR